MRRIAALAFVVFLGLGGEAASRSCRPTASDPPPEVQQQVWHDVAEFSFLIGRDVISEWGAMTLVKRLRPMGNFDALRTAAADWGPLQRFMHEWADSLEVLRVTITQLEGFCDQLDAVSLDPSAPLDEVAWMAGMARLERGIEHMIRGTEGIARRLEVYAGLVRAAATHHARGNHPTNPVIRIGPDPEAVAVGLGEVAARWRAILADLRNALAVLPVQPERQSERPIVHITAATTGISRAVASAAAGSRQRLPEQAIAHYESGNYLYDACPRITDGMRVALVDGYWTQLAGQAHALAVSGLLEPLAGHLPGGVEWNFVKFGQGFWLIRSALPTATPQALNVAANGRAIVDELRHMTGQMWRCAATGPSGAIRLYNLFRSEAYALDTSGNTRQAQMREASDLEGQLWRVWPR